MLGSFREKYGSKFIISCGIWTRYALIPRESAPKMGFRSVQTLLRNHPCAQHTDTPTDMQTKSSQVRLSVESLYRIYALRVGDAAYNNTEGPRDALTVSRNVGSPMEKTCNRGKTFKVMHRNCCS